MSATSGTSIRARAASRISRRFSASESTARSRARSRSRPRRGARSARPSPRCPSCRCWSSTGCGSDCRRRSRHRRLARRGSDDDAAERDRRQTGPASSVAHQFVELLRSPRRSCSDPCHRPGRSRGDRRRRRRRRRDLANQISRLEPIRQILRHADRQQRLAPAGRGETDDAAPMRLRRSSTIVRIAFASTSSTRPRSPSPRRIAERSRIRSPPPPACGRADHRSASAHLRAPRAASRPGSAARRAAP